MLYEMLAIKCQPVVSQKTKKGMKCTTFPSSHYSLFLVGTE